MEMNLVCLGKSFNFFLFSYRIKNKEYITRITKSKNNYILSLGFGLNRMKLSVNENSLMGIDISNKINQYIKNNPK